jgi:hypothetical protein
MSTSEDYYRARAIEALRSYGQTNATTPPSRTYWVYDAWKHGVRNIGQLAELAGVSRETIYSDLAIYEVEVAEDLERRLARWTEDVEQAGPVSSPDSQYMDITGNAYRRVWTAPAEGGGRIEITLTMWILGGATKGSWTRTHYDDSGQYVNHVRVPMTHIIKVSNANYTAIKNARGRRLGGSLEQAINTAVQQRISQATLTDLHASYRPSWI